MAKRVRLPEAVKRILESDEEVEETQVDEGESSGSDVDIDIDDQRTVGTVGESSDDEEVTEVEERWTSEVQNFPVSPRLQIENLMISLHEVVQLKEDPYRHATTQVVYGSARDDTGTGSLMAEHPAAGVAGRDHDEPLGNGVTNLLASDAGQIAGNLDSSKAPQEHEVIPVSIEPLPNEDVVSSDCGVGVVFERNETDKSPRQVSDPWLLETYSTFALRLTEEAIARITSHTTDLPRNPFQIGRGDLTIEPMEINVLRLDGAEELLN